MSSGADDWVKHRQRGSAVLMKLLARLSLWIGRPFGRAMLYPICAYFVMFAPRARRASQTYLTLALARPPGIRDVFRQAFSSTASSLWWTERDDSGCTLMAWKQSNSRCRANRDASSLALISV